MFKKINKSYTYKFNTPEDGLFCISVTASCKSGKLLGLFGGEDLRVEIDRKKFRELPPMGRTQYYNIPPAWNGTELRGLDKTVMFVLELRRGEHQLRFIPKNGARIQKEPKIRQLKSSGAIIINIQAQDGNRRPWITCALIDLPLGMLDVSAVCAKRSSDNDDLKIIIDGTVQKNEKSGWWGKDWYWRGSQLKGNAKEARFYPGLPGGTHYVEFWADRMPTIKNIVLYFKKDKEKKDHKKGKDIKRIPTVEDPKWTGNFMDDPENILMARLLFGEARNQPDEAKIWIAWSVINRTTANSWWPKKIKDAILQDKQYDPFKLTDKNFQKIIDPLGYENVDKPTKNSWFVCHRIAREVISGNIENPTRATHFHGKGVARDWFEKHQVPNGEFLKKISDTYFYWSPN